MIENRQHYRLRQLMDLKWSIPEKKIKGEGKIYNLSISGMLITTDHLFKPAEDLIVNFSSPQVPVLPLKGKLAWFKKLGKERVYYQCGVKFVKDESYGPSWLQWMEDNIAKLGEIQDSKMLKKYFDSGREDSLL